MAGDESSNSQVLSPVPSGERIVRSLGGNPRRLSRSRRACRRDREGGNPAETFSESCSLELELRCMLIPFTPCTCIPFNCDFQRVRIDLGPVVMLCSRCHSRWLVNSTQPLHIQQLWAKSRVGSYRKIYLQNRNLATKQRSPRAVLDYEPIAQRLAKKNGPVLLYDAKSNFAYIFGCYFIGFGLIGLGVINNHTKKVAATRDVPAYVPVFTAIGVAGLFGVGGWMCLRVSKPGAP